MINLEDTARAKQHRLVVLNLQDALKAQYINHYNLAPSLLLLFI